MWLLSFVMIIIVTTVTVRTMTMLLCLCCLCSGAISASLSADLAGIRGKQMLTGELQAVEDLMTQVLRCGAARWRSSSDMCSKSPVGRSSASKSVHCNG